MLKIEYGFNIDNSIIIIIFDNNGNWLGMYTSNDNVIRHNYHIYGASHTIRMYLHSVGLKVKQN